MNSLLRVFGVGYAVMKYRFLSWTPELVSNDILNSIDEPVILLYTRYSPVYLNKAAEEMVASLGGKEDDEEPTAAGLEMREIIDSTPSLAVDLERLLDGEVRDFSCRLLVSGNRKDVLGISLRTVKYHNAQIYSKLQVRNRIELFRMLESVSFPLLLKKHKK